MPTRVFLAGLFHETHTFLDGVTPLAAFKVREAQALLACRGDGSPLDGFFEVADRLDWDVVPAIDMRATPSATVDDDAVHWYFEAFASHLANAMQGGLDALFLVLHGAMVSETILDVEGELLGRIHRQLGEDRPPIFGVFDLHANFSDAMARGADALVAYRENPHVDARAASVRSAELLAHTLSTGERPHMAWRQAPVVWPPTGTGTQDDPMSSLEARARALERADRGLWVANVVAGFSFADTPDTGVSFVTVGVSATSRMERALDELVRLAWDMRRSGNRTDPPVADVLDGELASGKAPIVVAEPSDNIGGGAPGDGTGLLRALLERDVSSAVVVLNDPEAVIALQGVAIGEHRRLGLGGKGSRLDPGPVDLEVELVSRSDGQFTLEDPHSHLASMTGLNVDMGPCAVVRHAGISILLTSKKTPPFDLGQLRSQGLDPTAFRIIGVKAAVAHRRAYDPIAAAHATVDTPGPCSSDLSRYPFRHLRRPVFPLDQFEVDAPNGTPSKEYEA